MNNDLKIIKTAVYDKCSFEITHLQIEPESKEYGACRFKLNGAHIISRNAKKTPKKVGQFVTFWKRTEAGTIAPLDETDEVDFYVINVRTDSQFGQFVFPKSEMIRRNIISSSTKEGKRGFRVYPPWDAASNKQANQTQKWQVRYFYKIDDIIDLDCVKKLYLAR